MSLPCCYVTDETPFCDHRRLDGLPMCQKHMSQAFKDAIFDGLLPWDVLRDLVAHTESMIRLKQTAESFEIKRARQLAALDRQQATSDRRKALGVVYYVRLDAERIKIGTSRSLAARLSAMRVRPKDLLATEPGGVGLESDRHEQFKHLRIGRLEEFDPAPELLDHITDVRAAWGEPFSVPGAS